MSGANPPGKPSGLAAKLEFLSYGVRYRDVVLASSYPLFGAVLALPDLGWSSLLRLSFFIFLNLLFIAHIFIYNDLCDARINPEEPRLRARHALGGTALSEREVRVLNAALVVVSLLGYLLLSAWLAVLVGLIEAISYPYSHPRFKLKGVPGLSLSIHFFDGAFYVLGGWLVFRELSAAGVFLAVFVGLVMVAGHFFNEIDDFDQDTAVGIRTNAIAFGRDRTFWAGMTGFVAGGGLFFIGSWLWLPGRAYAVLGALLLAAWIIQAWRMRAWKAGDPIKSFRTFYRLVFALFTLALFAIKFLSLIPAP